MLQLDEFQSSVKLGINEQGQTSVPSRLGALLTVFLYFIVTAYGAYKVLRVVEKKNYNLTQSSEKVEFTHDIAKVERFTAEDGFKLNFSF